jgi:hypothetical protein
MKKQLINYETLLKVTKALSMSTEPEEVVQLTVESVKTSHRAGRGRSVNGRKC